MGWAADCSGWFTGCGRSSHCWTAGVRRCSSLHDTLGAGCSMSKIGDRHLTTIDTVGHGTDGEHAVGQRFPIDPPFGLVAMAWRDDDFVLNWLHRVMPRLTPSEIAQQQRVLTDIRTRGYGAWRFDDTHQSLHHRLSTVLASLEPTAQVARQLTTLMTMVTLQSVTDVLETELTTTEFVVLPIFGRHGQPEYQIEVHLGRSADLTLAALDAALQQAAGAADRRDTLNACLAAWRFGAQPSGPSPRHPG